MAKKKITCEINKELAVSICEQIVSALEGFPLEEASGVLNGIAVSLMYMANKVKKYETEKGAVERLILSWFVTCDMQWKTEYSKYINLPENE